MDERQKEVKESNVAEIRTLRVEKEEADPEVVELFRWLLSEAQEGKISAAMVTLRLRGKDFGSCNAGLWEDRFMLLGFLEYQKGRVIEEIWRNSETLNRDDL